MLNATLCAPALVAQEFARVDSMIHSPLREPWRNTPLYDLLLPGFLRIGYQTRAWVRESLPPAADSLDDLARLDMIYVRAVNEARGDIGRALLASLVAVFEHKTIPLSFGLHIPLTLEPEELFRQRVARLPRALFADRPGGDDSDKLQHFFGSAWLAWSLDNGEMADLIGIGIEIGEDAFIRGGVNDLRDIRANRLGQLFAELLRQHPHLLPSALFGAWNREYGRRVGRQ